MNRRQPIPRLHVVTDDSVLARPRFVQEAQRALEAGGVDLALHVRGPHTVGAEVYRCVEALVETAAASGSLLVVNDRVDVALALGTAVHLGGRSLPVGVVRGVVGDVTAVGVSAHGDVEVKDGARGGADYLFLGNVFATPSHPGRRGVGASGVASAVKAASDTPLLAIGGVTTSSVRQLRAAGAWGVAVLRGVWDAGEPEGAVRDYISALEGHDSGSRRGS